mgnify:CR=1 FL=1
MLNSLFIKWINAGLIKDLEETVTRIPKDLKTWKREIKKLKYKRKYRIKRKVGGYAHLYSYYLGKMIAYIHVLEQLGDSKFVTEWEKKFKVKYINTDNRGGVRIEGKW